MPLSNSKEILPSVRSVPPIFGNEYLFDKDHILSLENVIDITFIAREFTGTLMFAEDGKILFQPTDATLDWQLLLVENDETAEHEITNNSDARVEYGSMVIPLMRPGFTIYGHWLLDILPKLTNFERLNRGIKYEVLVDERCPQWAMDLIRILFPSCQKIHRLAQGVVAKGSFYFFSPLRRHDYISEACKINILQETKINRKHLLYVSRKNFAAGYRGMKNRQRIEDLFTGHGFELVHPEEYSIADQITMFSEAAIVAGEAGSALHNSVFCPENTYLINLQSGRQNHFIQASLCRWYRQNVAYIFGESETDEWSSDFTITAEYCERVIKDALQFLELF